MQAILYYKFGRGFKSAPMNVNLNQLFNFLNASLPYKVAYNMQN